jgi:cell wall-associated NlpC family hydrolase
VFVLRTPTGFRWSSRASNLLRSRTARVIAALAFTLPLATAARPAGADPISNQRTQAAKLARQLDALGLRVSQLSEAYDQARLRVETVNASIAAARSNLGLTSQRLDAARAEVRDLAISQYIHGGSAGELSVFVPHTTEELSVRNVYLRTVAGDGNDAIDALRSARAALSEQQAQLLTDQAAANKALAAADAARRAAAAADASERAALAKIQGRIASLVAASEAQRRARAAAQLQATFVARHGTADISGADLPLPPPGASGAVEEARRQLGKPYEYGGSGPDSFDCSGLTAWAWGHAGHPLPHSAAAQYDDTTHIPISALEPGDLVFYGSPPHHVGIYVGGGEMINALHSGTNVEYDSIYIEGDLIGGGRVN